MHRWATIGVMKGGSAIHSNSHAMSSSSGHVLMYLSPRPVCGASCHHRCAKNMPPLCGVNEKLLSEALKNVDQMKRNRRLVGSQSHDVG